MNQNMEIFFHEISFQNATKKLSHCRLRVSHRTIYHSILRICCALHALRNIIEWTHTCEMYGYRCSIHTHYNDVIMGVMASQISGGSIICSNVGSGTDQRRHQSFASLAFVWGIHRWPVNYPHKSPVMRKMLPFDDVIMLHTWTCKYHEISSAILNDVTPLTHQQRYAITGSQKVLKRNMSKLIIGTVSADEKHR